MLTFLDERFLLTLNRTFMQILGWLDHPGDLLSLVRTNKALRQILLDRQVMESTWRNVRKRVSIPGLPELPSCLNEVQYANLLFSEHCHVRHSFDHEEKC